MIGTQPTGAIAGAVISIVSHEGLSVLVDGKPAQLAIVLEDGTIYCAGKAVAREVEAVSINGYREFWKGKGFLRVYGQPLANSA